MVSLTREPALAPAVTAAGTPPLAPAPVAVPPLAAAPLVAARSLMPWRRPLSGPVELVRVSTDPWSGEAERGRDLLQGDFAFAGVTVTHQTPPWRQAGVPEGWRAALHGFDWIRHLRALGTDPARRFTRGVIADWLSSGHRGDAIVWRADVLAERIASWIGFHDFYCASADDDFRAATFGSLTIQARQLLRQANQTDPRHRLAAAKALILAGLALKPFAERLAFGVRMLERCLEQDFLADGHHRTRSPSALLAALRHLVEIRQALRLAQQPLPEGLTATIDRAAPAIRFFRHNDQSLACFHGGAEETPLAIDTVLTKSEARGRPVKSLSQGGFERLTAGRAQVIMDTGLPATGAWGAGAHAGLLAFEFSHGRDRIIVNCGTCPGHAVLGFGLRTTGAHSTVTIGDGDAVAFDRHGRITTQIAPVVTERRGNAEGQCLSAAHEGWLRSHGLTLRRRLFLAQDGNDLRGEDLLLAEGAGPAAEAVPAVHPFTIRFHLHPRIAASLVQSGDSILLRTASGQGWRFRASGAVMALEDSLYVGDGLMPRRCQQITLAGHSDGPRTLIKWGLVREGR